LILSYPRSKENEYKKLLLGYTRNIENIIKIKLISKLSILLADRDDFIRVDDFIDNIEDVISGIKTNIDPEIAFVLREMEGLIREIANYSSKQARRAVLGILPDSDIKVDIFKNPLNINLDKIIKSALITNTDLIKSIPSKKLTDISIIIQTGIREGTSIEELTRQLIVNFDISKNRARLIARDQTAKLHSNIIRAEHLQFGIKEYKWSTSHDDRVRNSHKVMDNKICSWLDETIYKNSINDKSWKKRTSIGGVEKQVGEDFQCRCSIIAITL
jgi:SPP1 gp7 family putative phage head morphogenesis protein